jgi:hypothetical protein
MRHYGLELPHPVLVLGLTALAACYRFCLS